MAEQTQTQTLRRTPAAKSPKKNKPKQPFNLWKWLFLVLIGLILGVGIFVGTKLFISPAPTTLSADVAAADEPVMNVQMTKKQVNRIVAYGLSDYLKSDDIKYQFKLTDQAVLSGNFAFLGTQVPFNLSLDPYVLENGDIQLKAQSLSIGALPIPISQVMNFIGHDYKIPSWVSLDTKKSTITLHLRKYKIKNGISLRATRFDLDNDELDFSVYLPK
ncbi:YpmS family protein [Lapidilactobacillus achengensis]|uniref:YpmS family protein n=1 Tax=Lapidilactobacillus achengensis TaxID=2486000 RepID=A0ABW1UP16_9LACO|nr:YpmS family protein [Lapidilactobacillus achengensis]